MGEETNTYTMKLKDDRDTIMRSLYTTVFSQKFNPDGTELAVCDNFGHIAVYRLSDCFSPDSIDKEKLPRLKFKVAKSSLYTLESKRDLLICAPVGEIVGYKWKDLVKSKSSSNSSPVKQSFSIKLPFTEDNQNGDHLRANVETNSVICDSSNESQRLFAGCGNGEIYSYDLETSKLITKYNEHKHAVYQILLKNNDTELVSASEDGEVKIWDLRAKNSTVSIKPFENALCARPAIGKYITSIAVDDDNWLICGGGPRMSMWHLSSLKPMSVLKFGQQDEQGDNSKDVFSPNVCRIHNNQIMTGGNSSNVFIHTFEAKLKTEIKTSRSHFVYDIAVNDVNMSKTSGNNKIMSVAGSSTSIDIVSNFAYRAATLNF